MEFVFIAIGYALALIVNKQQKKKAHQLENEGERLVRKKLKLFCSNTGSHLLNNVTLRLDGGDTTQIDHILVTQKGVFVVETKDYTGWIFGSATQPTWTQVHYRKKTPFQNPIRQNYKHIKAVESLLGFLPENAIKGVVVFTRNSEFKTNRPKDVLYEDEIGAFLVDTTCAQISKNQLQLCVGRIECLRMELTEETDIEHIENLKSRFY